MLANQAGKQNRNALHFVDLPSQQRTIEALVQNVRNHKSTLLLGERGIGKTLLARVVGERLQRPVEVFHFSAVWDPEAAIAGTMRLVDGRTVFVPSRFVEAISRPGTIVVLDEINRAPAEALNALLSLTDDQGTLGVDLAEGGRRVVALAEDVCFVATANVGADYIGAEPMDAALMDRMTFLRISYPEDEERLLTELGMRKGVARTLVAQAREIREQHARGALPFSISIRGLRYAGVLILQGVPPVEAFERNVAALDEEALSALRATLKVAS